MCSCLVIFNAGSNSIETEMCVYKEVVVAYVFTKYLLNVPNTRFLCWFRTEIYCIAGFFRWSKYFVSQIFAWSNFRHRATSQCFLNRQKDFFEI